jgi:hypothetical protein
MEMSRHESCSETHLRAYRMKKKRRLRNLERILRNEEITLLRSLGNAAMVSVRRL